MPKAESRNTPFFPPPAGQRLIAFNGGAAEAWREAEDLRFAFENAAIGMALTDAVTGRFMRVNQAFCDLTGYSRSEILSMDFSSLTHPADRVRSLELAHHALAGITDFRMEKRYIRKDGSEVWVRVNANLVRDAQGKPKCFISLAENMSSLKEAQENARRNEERWQLALQGTNDGIWDWDARTGQVFYSVRWKEMLGYQDHELLNKPETWERLVHPDDLAGVKHAVQSHLDRLTPGYEAEYRIRCSNGQYKWILARGKAVWDEAGKPIRMVGAHADITERKQAEERLVFNADHDALTGLVNRRYVRPRLDDDIVRCRARGAPFCLAICDIDHFKSVNDAYGHPAGDEVLVALARILRGCEGALAGRLGGDEFCLLLPDRTRGEASECLNRLREKLAASVFVAASGVVFSVTASMGIAQWERRMTSNALLAAADDALYAAKKWGRNQVY